jgi:GNAT superfamily N-acetyltransferase
MPRLPVEVRLLEPSDRDAWEPLWLGYQSFYRVSLPSEVTHSTWQRFHDPAEPVFARGAFAEDRLVGIVHYIFHRSTWMVGPTCYLQDLFVSPDWRGRGVGRPLIEAVYADAKRASASRVYWLTQEDNVVARRLYDRVATYAGFIQYRRQIGD